MPDKIIDGDSFNWSRRGGGNAGTTKYQHLLDGNARELKIADYRHTSTVTFLIVLRKVARDRGLACRSTIIDAETVAFQVTGERDE